MLSINYTSVRLTYTILCDEMYKSIQILLFADLNYKKKFEDIKGLIWGHKSNKDRQYNYQKKKDKTDV